MKTRILKSVLALAMMAMALPMMGQDNVNVNLKNGEVSKFYLNNVIKIFTSDRAAGGALQWRDYQFQYITTTDGEFVYDLDDIESLTFVKSEEPVVPDGPEAIDLGLPSGTKWASYNVGATKPEEYGGYYAWGETEEKETYTWENYIHCDGSYYTLHEIGSNISGTKYDVANVKWGDNWSMPTEKEYQELLNNCTEEWTTLNGVNGHKFTSKINGNSIFLPVVGSSGNYWTSTDYATTGLVSMFAYNLSLSTNYWAYLSNQDRCSGLNVRPVKRLFPLILSTESLILKIGEETILDITSGNGSYTAESDDESVAMVRVNDNSTLTITGKTLGIAKITVKDNISGRTAIVYALVTKNGLPDDIVDILPDYFATTTRDCIPEGWFALFGTEERPSQTSYGSGTRMFDFASGGDFTKGIYFREGYVEYGSTEGYPLTLESGKGYLISFTTAMWKDNGPNTRFEIINPAGEVVFVQVVDNSPNVNGKTAAVYDASKHSFLFRPDVSGNYVIRWTSSGSETGNPNWMEIILANPEVKCVPNDPNIMVLKNWESTNHDDGSTDSHTYQFSAEARDKLTFDWYVSSEDGWDYLTITLDGETIVSSSGVNSDTYQTYLTAGTHTLIATYRKDGSESRNNDNAGIRNIKITGFTIPEGNIEFADANVKAICVENWDTDGDGELSYLEASSVSTLGTLFKGNKDITSFNELQYFVGLSEIGDEAFTECENLTSIEIPYFATSIGVCAFSMCHGLNNISIPNFVTSLGDFAFSGCINLTSIEIPRSVTSIGTNPFAYNSLSNIVVVSGNPNYDSRNSNAIIETATNTLIAGCKNTVIPNTVTSIGDFAFKGCSELKIIKIPYTVTNIGSGAFWSCSGLTNVEIPNSVSNIGSEAFSGCLNLTSVKIPYSITNISSRAFESCPALTDVYCSTEQVPSTDSNAFENTNISSATLHVLSSALDSYSSTAPWSGFGSIVAINSFEEGDSALIVLERKYWIEHGNNYSYPRFTLLFNNNVSLSIGYFNGDYWHSTYNESIKGIHIFSNINGMDEKEWFISDFMPGEWIKEKLIVSENGIVQYYMDDRLIDVVKFDHLNLQEADQVHVDVDPFGWWPGHKQYMDDFVFTTGKLTISDDFNDNSLNLNIWETPVNADGVREEDGVVKLEQIRTDEDFHLRSKSFALRGRIIIMKVKQILEDWESTNHDDGSTDFHTYEFSVDDGDKLSFDWYVSSESGWDYLTITLDGETIVSSSGVNNGSYTTTLTSGSHTLVAYYSKDGSVSHYNDNAGIKNIMITGYYVIPEGNIEFADVNVKALCVQNWDTNGDGELSYIEAYLVKDLGAAFTNHMEITTFNELQYFLGMSGIGDDAFNNCTGLTSVKIPYSVSSIERYAFKGCTGLTTIEIPYSVTSIGYGVFSGCTGLTSIKIPSSITSIDDRTFEGCIGLTSIKIPNSVTRIEDYAFYGCTGLTSIEIPNSVAFIERYVFAGCTGLTSIEIPWSVTSIEDYAFSGCTGLTSIEIPSSVTSIGENAFGNCDGLADIHWTPNAATEAASPLAPSTCVLYLFKNDGENAEKVEQLATLFDGQFKAIYVIEGTLELTAYFSDEPDDDYYYCTYYDHDFSLMITDGEAQAFSATYDNSSLTLHTVKDELVYADYPIIFRTTEPHVSLYIVSNVSGTNTADNDLQGTVEEMTVKRSDNIYVLYNGGFHLTEGTIPAHKAYLDLADEMLAPDCLSFAEDGATSINDANYADEDADGTWYSVNGQRVEKPTKGVFIKNGKKYLFK